MAGGDVHLCNSSSLRSWVAQRLHSWVLLLDMRVQHNYTMESFSRLPSLMYLCKFGLKLTCRLPIGVFCSSWFVYMSFNLYIYIKMCLSYFSILGMLLCMLNFKKILFFFFFCLSLLLYWEMYWRSWAFIIKISATQIFQRLTEWQSDTPGWSWNRHVLSVVCKCLSQHARFAPCSLLSFYLFHNEKITLNKGKICITKMHLCAQPSTPR